MIEFIGAILNTDGVPQLVSGALLILNAIYQQRKQPVPVNGALGDCQRKNRILRGYVRVLLGKVKALENEVSRLGNQ